MHLASPVSFFCSLWLALPSELAGLHAASDDHCLNLIVDVLNKVSWIIAVWPHLFLYLRFGPSLLRVPILKAIGAAEVSVELLSRHAHAGEIGMSTHLRYDRAGQIVFIRFCARTEIPTDITKLGLAKARPNKTKQGFGKGRGLSPLLINVERGSPPPACIT